MPGTIDKIYAQKGARVQRGDKLLTVSAMKMEVHVTAPFDGTVEEISVKTTDKVDQGTLLANLAPLPEKISKGMPRVESLASFSTLPDRAESPSPRPFSPAPVAAP